MAAVTLTISSSQDRLQGDVSDTLSGGSNGADLGQATNSSYSPLVGAQSENGGAKTLYIRHDAQYDPVTNVGFYVAAYSGTYGGPSTSSPSADLAEVLAAGAADNGGTANNTDGLSSGLHIDMSYAISQAGQFAPSREASGQKRVFGKSYAGQQLGTSGHEITLHQDACFYLSGSNKLAPSAPVAGKIGVSGDQVLGDQAMIRLRYYMPASSTTGGTVQFNFVTIYSYTA